MTERQKRILNMLIEAQVRGALSTSSGMARDLKVTSRTIQSDIKALGAELASCGATITTVPGKGYRLDVEDSSRLFVFLNDLANDDELRSSLDSKEDRIRFVVGKLLFAHEPVLSDHIAYEAFVSRSQLSTDLRDVRALLERYGLALRSRSHQGLTIEGSEEDKRTCLIREQVARQRCMGVVGSHASVGDVVLEVLTDAQYEVPDLDLQNLIVILETSLARIKARFELSGVGTSEERRELSRELRVARDIYDRIDARFGLYGNDAERLYLARVLRGSRAMTSDELISDETERFVLELLEDLRERYGLDFTNDPELRINLALHLVPLVTRARSGLLTTNPLLGSIKESLPLAYDIAVMAAHLIELHYNVFLNEDEAGHLALYFGMAQKSVSAEPDGRHVLILTSSRTSDSLLLRFNFTKLFGELVRQLDVMQVEQLANLDLDRYDAIFSTVDSPAFATLGRPVTRIDYFLTDRDRYIIREMLTTRDGQGQLASLFSEDLFFSGLSFASKEKALAFLCAQVARRCQPDGDLLAAVMRREALATTSFSDLVALPHPDVPLTSRTIIACAVLDEPVDWGEGKRIRFIFLFCVRPHGEQDLEALYGFMAWFMQSHDALARLGANPTFETFAELVAGYGPGAGETVPL